MNQIKNPGIRYGILGGLAVVFFFALLYYGRKELFVNPWCQWGSLVIYLIFMYQASREDCAEFGTGREFRMVVRTPFMVFLLINLAYWLFFYAIHLADKSLIVLELDKGIQMLQQQLLAGAGDPAKANEIRQQIEQMEKMRATPVQPLVPVLAQMLQGALGGFALAAGIAALVKNSRVGVSEQKTN
jgi:hypothetical protein